MVSKENYLDQNIEKCEITTEVAKLNKYKDLDETEVINAAKAGDELAMEFLLEKYQGLMGHICEKYFLRDGERDDLMQEAMIGFVQAVHDYKPESGKQFKNFAFLCVKRELDSCIKRSNRKKHMILNEAVPISCTSNDDDEITENEALLIERDKTGTVVTPESVMLAQESCNETTDLLVGILSKLEYKVLIMRLMGYSYNEITLLLQLENKSVDNAMQRIRKKLSKKKYKLGLEN